jgi:SAM-dependent methyltransferase
MLMMILRSHQYMFMPPARVLDVAPAAPVRNFLKPRLGPRYVGSDLFEHPRIGIRADLTSMCFDDASFDVIICYHVLEHIPADKAAIEELARVLKPGGLAIIQVPRRPGAATDEDPSAPVEERIRRFGQDDHVRMYGADFEERLRAGGLIPQTLTPAAAMSDGEVARLGLARAEEVWLCRRADGEGSYVVSRAIAEAPVLRIAPARGPVLLRRFRPVRSLPRRATGKLRRAIGGRTKA